MDVPLWVWTITIAGIVGLLAFDFFFHVRKAHIPTLREAAVWSAIYVGLALAFGVLVMYFGGAQMGAEYFAGWTTEKALSVDNLFVFLIIIASFKVPREDQQKVLLFGIVFALIARSVFIAIGAAMIENFSWTFYFFGAILLYTAISLMRPEKAESDDANNFIIRFAKRHLHTSDHYDGDKLFTYENGKRVLTPMLLVMLAIGGTDVLFAIDSVPAIYGLTTNVYIVFTATAFSLMGLRQLYFLIDGLLDRLVYLKYGLALILAFIGVKMVLEALHHNQLGFINGGQPLDVPEVEIGVSLTVILSILAVTVLVSLLSPQGRVDSVVKNLDRWGDAYLMQDDQPTEGEDQGLYNKIVDAEQRLAAMKPERVQKAIGASDLEIKLHQVHERHQEESDYR